MKTWNKLLLVAGLCSCCSLLYGQIGDIKSVGDKTIYRTLGTDLFDLYSKQLGTMDTSSVFSAVTSQVQGSKIYIIGRDLSVDSLPAFYPLTDSITLSFIRNSFAKDDTLYSFYTDFIENQYYDKIVALNIKTKEYSERVINCYYAEAVGVIDSILFIKHLSKEVSALNLYTGDTLFTYKPFSGELLLGEHRLYGYVNDSIIELNPKTLDVIDSTKSVYFNNNLYNQMFVLGDSIIAIHTVQSSDPSERYYNGKLLFHQLRLINYDTKEYSVINLANTVYPHKDRNYEDYVFYAGSDTVYTVFIDSDVNSKTTALFISETVGDILKNTVTIHLNKLGLTEKAELAACSYLDGCLYILIGNIILRYSTESNLSSIQTSVSDNDFSIFVYPNPARKELHITSSEPIKAITLTNLLGQTVYTSKTITNNTTIATKQLPKGTYILTVQTNKSIQNKRVIIE